MGFNTNNNASKFFICCKGCKDRTMTCHSTCPKYLKGKLEYEKLKNKNKLEKDILTKNQAKMMRRKAI